MKVAVSQTTQLVLTELESLDPITVYLENHEPGRGRITIQCFDASWTAAWGAMGGRSVEAFFISCDDHYLAKNLSSIRDEVMAEGEAMTNYVRGHIIQRRKWREFDKERARELWDAAEGIEVTNSYCSNPGLMLDAVGDEWWYGLPMVENPDYTYLCRIIQAVRDGLREYTKNTTAAAA
ncbi:hypothetical protein ACTG2C_22585 [Aeromonas veronii]|nr:hypothetical protein [Aeromonas veronii]